VGSHLANVGKSAADLFMNERVLTHDEQPSKFGNARLRFFIPGLGACGRC
jgi:hypothetical protein